MMLEAISLTLELTATGFTIGLALGLLTAIGRTYGPLPLRTVLAAYIEAIRGTPMLVQLFFVYYATPSLGIRLDPLTASIVAIGLNSAAYQAEYFRMAFGAIQRDQWDAALSIGLSKWGAIRSVVVPQAVRIVIPALTNEAIYLLKYSSIAYFVTVPELVYVSKVIGARTLLHIQIYTISAAFYIAAATLLLKLTRTVESKVAVPGLVVRGRT
jgi:polar amino acid transport system permease protein